jgi:DNA-binding transcriptional LysR family regulator
MNVGLRQLRAFLAVARRGSFTRAAEDVALSQSAVSLSVRQLEN